MTKLVECYELGCCQRLDYNYSKPDGLSFEERKEGKETNKKQAL